MQMKIVLIGDTETGKTSITKILNNEVFNEKERSTIGMYSFRRTITNELKQDIWDISGQEKATNAVQMCFKDVNAVILVVDGTQALQLPKHIKSQLKKAKVASPQAKFYVAINKCEQDQLHADFNNENEAKERLKQALNSLGISNLADNAIFFCSAKTQENVNELFAKVATDFQQAPLIPANIGRQNGSSSLSESFLSWWRNLASPTKVWLSGHAVILLGAIVFFILAALTVGSFLTFGILPSAFMGAAIITGSALLIWNLGYAIYKAGVHFASPHRSSNVEDTKPISNEQPINTNNPTFDPSFKSPVSTQDKENAVSDLPTATPHENDNKLDPPQ